MECLETDKICGNVKKCKVCIFDDCRKTLQAIEEEEKIMKNRYLENIRNQLNDSCKNCNMLQILDKEKVYCPYMLKNECLISGYIRKGDKND